MVEADHHGVFRPVALHVIGVALSLGWLIYVATSQALDDRVRTLADRDPGALRAVVLDFEAVTFIDSQGAEQLAEIHRLVDSYGAALRLARVKPPVLAVLRADGFIDRIGDDHLHGNVHRAVEAQRAAGASQAPAPGD